MKLRTRVRVRRWRPRARTPRSTLICSHLPCPRRRRQPPPPTQRTRMNGRIRLPRLLRQAEEEGLRGISPPPQPPAEGRVRKIVASVRTPSAAAAGRC